MLSLKPFTFDFTTIDLRTILTLLGILVAIGLALYFQWWRNRKRMSYEINSDIQLISTQEELEGKVEIRYEGRPVKDVHLLVIRLINDGYQSIKKDDFEKEVKFVFPGATILTAKRIKFQPENISTQLTYRDNWLTVDPALFNRKDHIQFKLILTGYKNMEIDARIVGVSAIGKVRSRFIGSELMYASAFLILLIGGFSKGFALSPFLDVPLELILVLFILASTVSLGRMFFDPNKR
jgi:hypothetical protein